MRDVVSATPKTIGRVSCVALLLAILTTLAWSGTAFSQQSEAGVRVTDISDTPDPVGVGEEVTYKIVVRNFGPGPADDVEVLTGTPSYERFSSDVEMISSELSFGPERRSCPADERGYIDCRIGAMAAGEEATLTLTARPGRLGELRVGASTRLGGPSIDDGWVEEKTSVIPPEHCTVSGTEGDDVLGYTHDEGAVLCGFGGDDTFLDATGVTIYAGSGDDTTRNMHGTNTIYAGEGRDSVFAGLGKDRVYGGPGDDRVSGGNLWGADVLYGGSGVDVLKGGAGRDKVHGGDQTDILNVRDGVGNDEAYGGAGKDTIYADSGDRARD